MILGRLNHIAVATLLIIACAPAKVGAQTGFPPSRETKGRLLVANLTARVQVTLPADVKARLRKRAEDRGVSLSAVMRDIVDDLIAGHDLLVALAQLEQRDATIQ